MAMWNSLGPPGEPTPGWNNQFPVNRNPQYGGGSPYEERQYPAAAAPLGGQPMQQPQPGGYSPNPNFQPDSTSTTPTQPAAHKFWGIPIPNAFPSVPFRLSIPKHDPQAPAYASGLDAQSPNTAAFNATSPSHFQHMNNMDTLSPIQGGVGGGAGGSAAQSPAAFSNASGDDAKPKRTTSKRTGRPPIWDGKKTRALIRNYLWSGSKLPRTLQFFHADENPDQPHLPVDKAKSQQNGAQKKLNQTIARDPRSLKGNEKDKAVLRWRVQIPERSQRHIDRNAQAPMNDACSPQRQHTMVSIKIGAVTRSFSGLSMSSRKAFTLLKNLTLKSEPDSTISRQGTAFDPVQHHEAHDEESYLLLPGDFLTLDSQNVDVTYILRQDHEESYTTYDMIWAEMRNEPNIWVTPKGLSDKAQNLLLQIANASKSVDLVNQTDCFGNTILHLLAARRDRRRLDSLFEKGLVTLDLMMAKNTARQTFLHVLSQDWFTLVNNDAPIFGLCRKIEQIDENIQIFKQLAPLRDVYGQTVFHHIKRGLPEPQASDVIGVIEVMMVCDPDIEYMRDAFGCVAVEASQQPQPASLAGHVVKNDQQLPFRPYQPVDPSFDITHHILNNAVNDKHLEDGSGNGALHCLAAVSQKMQPGRKRKASEPLDPGRSPAGPGRSRDTTPGEAMASPGGPASPTAADDPITEICRKAEELITAGCSVSHYDRSGKTALMAFIEALPADSLKIPILKTLVDAAKKEDMLEARSSEGETALLLASRLGKIAAVRELAAAGANQYARTARHGCVRGIICTIYHEQAKHKHDPPNLDTPWGRLEASLKALVVPERDNSAHSAPMLPKYPDVIDEWGK